MTWALGNSPVCIDHYHLRCSIASLTDATSLRQETTATAPDETVRRVQQQLQALGYPEVGSLDYTNSFFVAKIHKDSANPSGKITLYRCESSRGSYGAFDLEGGSLCSRN